MKSEPTITASHVQAVPGRSRRLDTPVADKPITESFRLLALNVRRLIGREERRAVAVLSAWPDDGRSLVALSLARELAHLMPPVLMVDADPAGSGIKGFGLSARWNGHGPDFVAADGGVSSLRILTPPRDWPQNPLVFLEQIQAAMERAMGEGMTVIVDTPACTTSSIAFHMAQAATSVLYVARRGRKTNGVHQSIRSQLDLLGVRVLGVVFNEV